MAICYCSHKKLTQHVFVLDSCLHITGPIMSMAPAQKFLAMPHSQVTTGNTCTFLNAHCREGRIQPMEHRLLRGLASLSLLPPTPQAAITPAFSSQSMPILQTKRLLRYPEERNWGLVANQGRNGGYRERKTFVHLILLNTVASA